jgi:hypothetical protein
MLVDLVYSTAICLNAHASTNLIGESENPGVSELIDTIIPPDDGLGDVNTPTMNQDYRLHEARH